MRKSRLCLALFTLWFAPSALALDDVIPSPPPIEVCERVILPTHVYARAMDGDVEGFARDTLTMEQNIRWTRAYFEWEEAGPFTIFVDLFHDHLGGLIEIDIVDQYGNPTWSTVQPVPTLMTDAGLVRKVIAVSIPPYELEAAFPRTSVYAIRASAYPLRDESPQCAFSAATSILVRPSYPSAYP